MENDVLQVGLALATGRITAGAGSVQIFDGGITIVNDFIGLSFGVSDPTKSAYLKTDSSDNFVIDNSMPGKAIILYHTSTDEATPSLSWGENLLVSNQSKLEMLPGSAGLRVQFGYDHYIDALDVDGNGSATVYLNERNKDIDVQIEGASGINLISDAGLNAIGIGGAAESGYKLKVHGKVNLASGNTYDINGSPHVHINSYTETLGTFLGGGTVPASTTHYTCPWKDTTNTTQNNYPWQEAGTLQNLTLRAAGTQPASGSLVLTLMVNGVDTALTVTVPAGTVGAATYTDSTHTVNISAGDLLMWKLVNNATGASGTLTGVNMQLKKFTGS